MPQTSFSSDDVAARSLIRPDWHAFGMLVAWSAAGSVVLLSYAQTFAHSLDGPRLTLIAAWLLWLTYLAYLAYLAVLARESIFRTRLWLFGPAPVFFVLPLLLWSTGEDLQLQRFPAIEAMIISIVNHFLSVLPLSGVVAQHALYLSVACLEHWTRLPPTGLARAVTQLLVSATNFVLGICACCLLCLAHNRRITLSSPPSSSETSSAGEQADRHAHKQPVVRKATSASQLGLSRQSSSAQSGLSRKTSSSQPDPSCKPSDPAERSSAPPSPPSLHSQASLGPTLTPHHSRRPSAPARQPQPKPCISRRPSTTAIHPQPQLYPGRKPSANPTSPGSTPLLRSLCCKATILAWVQEAELRLMASVPQEEAQLLASLLAAVVVVTRFLAYVANFTVPGSLAQSPTMDMLGLLCGMMVGGSKISDLLHAQHRAYRCVRGLLRNIVPAHVADALEVHEAERELAASPASTGKQSGALMSNSKQSTNGARSSFSESVSGVLPKPWPRLNRSREEGIKGARSWSGNPMRQSPGLSSTLAHSAHPLPGNDPTSESNPLGSEHKLGLERWHSLSERHEQVTILFADIANFTDLSDRLHPSEVMALLGGLCKEYDQRAVEMGLYTVDVIGDCYMCAANLIKPLPNHVSATVGFAQSILQVANATLTPLGTPLRIRIGIHSGPAMSGVIGVHHLKFTLVGDTVNVASRMESTAVPNTIQLSEDAYKQLQREQLAIKSEAAEEQGLERGGFADQEMLSQASEEDGHAGHAFVRGNSAPPCSLDSMPKNRWEDSAELGGLLGSRSINERRTELAAMAELHHRQQCPATAAQALLGPVAPVPRHSSTEQAAQQCPGTAAQAPVAPEPRHGNTETAAQAQQHQCQHEPVPLHYEDEHKHEVPLQQQQPQQQQGCHLQPWVHRRNGQDQLQQPQSIREQSCSLSQGASASCAAMPAEQSDCTFAEQPLSSCSCAKQPQSSSLYAEQSRHTCRPGGPEHALAAAMPAEQSSRSCAERPQSSCPCAEQSRHTYKPGGWGHVPARPSCQSQAWRPEQCLDCQTPGTRHPAQVAGHHTCGWEHRTTRPGGGDQGPGCSISPDNGLAYLNSLDQALLCPDGQDGGPACCLKCSMKRNWLERELNIKGKGVMKACTYTGPCHHRRQEHD